MQNPVITRVNCRARTSAFNVIVSWNPIASSTYFYVGVFDPSNQSVAHKVVDSSRGSMANLRRVTLDPTTAYTVRVAQCDKQGELTSAYSQPFHLIQNELKQTLLTNDLNAIEISAKLPTLGAVTGITAALYDSDNNLVDQRIITGAAGTFVPDLPLDPTRGYRMYLMPVSDGGASQGPSTRRDLVMTRVGVATAAHDGKNLTVTADAKPAAGESLLGALLADGRELQTKVSSGKTVSLPLDTSQLDLARRYAATLRIGKDDSYGPASAATPIVVTPPTITSAAFVDKVATIAWDVPPVAPTPVGAKVAAVVNGKVFGQPQEAVGYRAAVDLTGAGAVTSLKLQVNSRYGVATGPPVSVDALVTAPALSSVERVHGTIEAAWTDQASPTGYRVSLDDSQGRSISQAKTSDTAVALAAPLNPDTAYQLRVQAHETWAHETNAACLARTGPWSTPLQVLAQTPVVTATAYDGKSTTVHWQAPAKTHGITGFTASLLEPENLEPLGHTASAGAKDTRVDIAHELDSHTRYVVAVRATGTHSGGNWSWPIEVLAAAPRVTAVALDAAHRTLSWDPVPDPKITGYVICYKDAAQADQTAYTTRTSIELPAKSTHITLAARNDLATGPKVSPPANTLGAPTVDSVVVEAGEVRVAWSGGTSQPGTSPPGYRLLLTDGAGTPLAQVETADQQAALPAVLGDAGTYQVEVQAYGKVSGVLMSGPASAAVGVLPQIPVIDRIDYDGKKVTVHWQAPAHTQGITGFTAALLDPETKAPTKHTATAGPGDTKADITQTIDAASRYLVAVRATGTKTSGAWGTPVGVISARPAVTSAEVSAGTVSLAWTPVEEPGVTGYIVRISDQAATPTVKTLHATEPSITFANDLTPAQVHATVAARNGADHTGPEGPAFNLFGAAPSYYPQTISGGTAPYLVRATSNQPQPEDLVFAFPDVFTATPSPLPSSGLFTLEKNPDSTVYPYKLTVAHDSVAWKFDKASRATLAADFTKFLKAMEKPDGQTVTLEGGALDLVRQQLALGLPLLYGETLEYRYGFNPDNQTGGYVDLVPGMRLRVDGEVFQIMPPSNEQIGYVANGTSTYDIHSYVGGSTPAPLIGFDAFFSAMARPTVPSPLTDTNAGGGGVIDLYTSAGRLPYFRLLYPAQIKGPKFSELIDQANLPVILGAPDYDTLLQATDQYVSQGNFAGIADVFPFFFRGRDMPVPEISVSLNGETRWVPLGTTVANLLETLGGQPACVEADIGRFTMSRSIGALTDDVAAKRAAQDAVAANRVRLEYPSSTFRPAQPGYFGLPLQAGDSLTV